MSLIVKSLKPSQEVSAQFHFAGRANLFDEAAFDVDDVFFEGDKNKKSRKGEVKFLKREDGGYFLFLNGEKTGKQISSKATHLDLAYASFDDEDGLCLFSKDKNGEIIDSGILIQSKNEFTSKLKRSLVSFVGKRKKYQ